MRALPLYMMNWSDVTADESIVYAETSWQSTMLSVKSLLVTCLAEPSVHLTLTVPVLLEQEAKSTVKSPVAP